MTKSHAQNWGQQEQKCRHGNRNVGVRVACFERGLAETWTQLRQPCRPCETALLHCIYCRRSVRCLRTVLCRWGQGSEGP